MNVQLDQIASEEVLLAEPSENIGSDRGSARKNVQFANMKTKVGWFLAATKLNKAQTKKDRYEAFLQRLPKQLSGIENKPDDDAFTPLFKKHCRNLEDFGVAIESDDKEWEKRQRKEFRAS